LIRRVRYYLFLKDVLLLALTTFGGPQAHLAHFQKILVTKRKYLSEHDLMELNSLCQVLPGPSSTQILVSVAFKIGGPNLAYLTLLTWTLPSIIFMTVMAIALYDIQQLKWSLEFTRFIQPMAVGFISYAAYTLSIKTVRTKTAVILMMVAAVISYLIQSPFMYPAILIVAGAITALKFKAQPKKEKQRIRIDWSNFILWAGVLIVAASLGWYTRDMPEVTRPIRLFENFYRNGSLVFGGGQVLTPMMYTEFVKKDSVDRELRKVEFRKKEYLTHDEFLTGYAISQSLPGPVFGFCAFVGSLAMREYGTFGEILGALMSSAGIFLPGTFLIFFVIRFWESLKNYRGVRASLEGITAASAGFVITAAIVLFQPLENTFLNFAFTLGTFGVLTFTRIPAPVIIILGLLLGLIL